MDGAALLSWTSAHSGALNVALNAAMVGIWLVYLQIFLASFIRQRRPSILITRGGGHGLEARCMIANMSLEPVYVLSLVALLKTGRGAVSASITDISHPVEDGTRPLSEVTRQGPLDSGAYMAAGSFGDSLRRLDPDVDVDRLVDEGRRPTLEILVFAIHGSDDLIVGASRSYRLERRGGRIVLAPKKLHTTQVRGRLRRRLLVRRWAPQLMS